jgi:4'-phosphopantetheinyl transferase
VRSGVAHLGISAVAGVLLEAPVDHAGWMSDSERARFAGMRVEPRRLQYVAGHWLARVLLANAFGGNPDGWRLFERRSLPPRVEGRDGLAVSISHSGDWIAAAVATVPVGIDIEQRPRALDASIESLLLEDEEAPGSLDADALLQRWVAKEAWIKRAAGSALPSRLKQVRLHATQREHASVFVESHAAFHVAIAIDPGCALHRHGPVLPAPGACYAAIERAVAVANGALVHHEAD